MTTKVPMLTDEEIRQFVIVFARDWKARTGKNSRHVRIEFAVAATVHVLSALEARLAEEAKVRAQLVEALNRSNDTLGFLAWEVFGAPNFTDRHDDQGVCTRRIKANDAALAAAKEIK